MSSYYIQYIINENAYKCALDTLGEEVSVARIEEVSFPAFRHYGEVLHELISVLVHRKPPIDAELIFEAKDAGMKGKLIVKY